MKIVEKITKWFDERTGLGQVIIDAATHPVPPEARWYYVFGTAILSSFILQAITGVALATLFVPSAGSAYESIRVITNEAAFGKLLRGMHYFGASSMILFVGIHMIRVFLTGSYKFPREFNWLSGVFLLFFTVAMGFTGQVLRWDQNAVWTVAVGAEQALRAPFVGKILVEILLSGFSIGSGTVSHFFVLHVFLFPAAIIGIVSLHLYLVLYNGISEPAVLGEPVDPQTYKSKYREMLECIGRPFWPDAAWRDLIFSTLVVIGILVLAFWCGPPELGKPPDPALVKAHPRPDWYLIWYFALLALLPHHAEDYVIIWFPVAIGILFFAVPFISNRGERSLKRRPWAVAIVLFVISFVGALWLAGEQAPWTPKFAASPLTADLIGASSGTIFDGAQVFNKKGCLYCHAVNGHGGQHGPDLSNAGNRLTHSQIILKIINGGYNMPSYANNISPQELSDVSAFLESRKK